MEKEILVYKIPWLLDRVYRESDKLLCKITDTTRFEDRCIKGLGEYLMICENNKHNKRYLEHLIIRKVKEAEENFKKEDSVRFSEIEVDEEISEEIYFDPEDVLANVESEVMQKETAALLAQGDCKKTKILGYWLIGNSSSTHISRSLARTYGGNEESHRKYVQRFRKSCAEHLSTAI